MATIASLQPTDACGSVRRMGASIASGFDDLTTTFAAWRSRTQRRRAAVRIDRWTLADIGLVRAQIDHEAAKPFWKP